MVRRFVSAFLIVVAASAAVVAQAGQPTPTAPPAPSPAPPPPPAQAPASPQPAAQQPGAQPTQPGAQRAAEPTAADKPAFKEEELDQMVAPLALYPDSLLSQILMASTYPLEIVQADRWAKANKSLQGDALAKALEAQTWDPSVKSLVNFPDVLAMLSDRLDWTMKLGDAFIGQQKELMAAVQKLRLKAKDAGNLVSTQQQTVNQTVQDGAQVIVIESSSPDVVYVPTYDPSYVYGTWWYPAYPPYPYYPPGYYYPWGGAGLAFGTGVLLGLAWGYAWGGCNWGRGDVNIDIDRNSNRNRNINRDQFRNRSGQNFRHDSGHRRNVPYRNQAAANRFGGRSTAQAAQARQEFRGRGGMEGFSRANPGSARAPSAVNRAGAGSARPSGGFSNSRPSAAQRPASRSGGNAFSGAGTSRQQTARQSQRGSTSRSSAGASRSSGSRSGGGSRGGGGRGGGGRR